MKAKSTRERNNRCRLFRDDERGLRRRKRRARFMRLRRARLGPNRHAGGIFEDCRVLSSSIAGFRPRRMCGTAKIGRIEVHSSRPRQRTLRPTSECGYRTRENIGVAYKWAEMTPQEFQWRDSVRGRPAVFTRRRSAGSETRPQWDASGSIAPAH